MFSPIDIQDELVKTRQKHAQIQHSLMQQVEAAMKKGQQADEYIMTRLRKAPKPGKWKVDTSLLDKNKIFSLDDIKSICVQYRLRFLDSKYFRMEELPYDAMQAIKNLEKETGKEISHVKMMASAKFFKLEDINKDPLLFAQIDDTNFYLIHKWGSDFKWYKKWLSFPMRSLWSLFISIIVVGLPIAYILPLIWFHTPADRNYYQTLYLAAFTIYTIFTIVYGGFTFYRRFSKACWNSPYFN